MTEPTPSSLPPSGWYPDPSGAEALRWWNGVTWSDTTHPLSPSAGPVPALVSPPTQPSSAPWPTTQSYVGPAPSTTGPRRRTWIVVTAVVVVVAVLGATLAGLGRIFGDRHLLDTHAVAQQISDSLSRQNGQQVTVDCPGDMPLQAGATFTCTYTAEDGSAGDVLVTQDDDQGDVSWSVNR